MIPLLQLAKLVTDLEAGNQNFLNVADLDPVPPNLALSSDARLTDAREPLPGSVTNLSVDPGAGIKQSKLNLDGNIPSAWLGTTSTTAARGDLAEYVANKGQPNGYAELDSGGKVPTGQIPTSVGTGTVTSVALTMPAEFSITGSPVTGAGTLAVDWAPVDDLSWFGNMEGAPGPPQFYTDPLPAVLIPDLDTSKVTTGTLAAARLPAAIGLGGSHASGAVPDPGDGSGGALATDYLARDMSYQPLPELSLPYQPNVSDPVLTPSSNPTGDKTVVFSVPTSGATMFYSLTSDSADFVEVPAEMFIALPPSDTVWCYAAKTGYNNSNIVNYTNPNP